MVQLIVALIVLVSAGTEISKLLYFSVETVSPLNE